MSVDLTITDHTQALSLADRRWLKRYLLQTLELLRIKHAEWSITIVNDPEMTDLHARTLNLPTTTDVLTFDLRENLPATTKEGSSVELDTVLCRDEALRRAKELGHPPREELLLYAIHSLLHVQGHNDLKKSDATRMHHREDSLLTSLGIGARFTPKKPKPRKRHTLEPLNP
jgi:probable rRNA maturation factor